MPLHFANNMRPNKGACAPVYFEPQIIKDSALTKLDALENNQSSLQWVDGSAIFLKEDGSFSDLLIEEGSLRVRTQQAFLSMARLFSSRGKEEQTLHHARRRLLVSLLAHSWLWGRPKVLDTEGNPVAFKERRVLDPQNILNFLAQVRARKESCTYDKVKDLLLQAEDIALHKDMSKWNITGVIACLRWDKSHDIPGEGPWCSCRLKKKGPPPPYHEALQTKTSVWSSVSPIDSDPGSFVTAQQGGEKDRM
ncbi:hypothetical protein FOXG_20916 [Fusarium oxysporum f. sp. lycopersici 4287]|uniref:Uncharacterized protein n=1 Tax=Fusarium oxysporum f. sp. lycopersici (strain 4287 / CBS 123668 / FGSC 9935 / NRRL 34936) TaxID=426428 RepID=A0A0J9VSP0_FUSO4|nr:hypothetical protein FOXG_20916 [Fusarium oxysporum f. sp. lycopersici 4287]XP_018251817.1 hypothetical protein FOXG_20916 [Fusarium oxysporum f. sp. lycopersici 4287]EWZ78177.1 hypothetical protein FOWG_17508 [Fusarium oxysporum f. sp. lycopersici MN25]KAJ9413014.1 hypothetical protein QL093DRAFT_1129297 [Fusarium oxysporum]EWZ78178.1 hypothetical protein FOWG_17508 [Fusarium oxysporum f. sp. lycopersici MN25]KNB13771.1 hypothetical protein FOXG_20916 [Fusarium oxysporum f. sp. lycopersici